MITIIQAWLKDAVGVVIDLDEFRNVLKDGMLFIRILRFYDVINVNSVKNVFPSEDKNVCKNNLIQLKIWFEMIGIEFTNDIINKIVEGNLSTCVNILYQLYLVFVRGSLTLPTKQNERCFKNQYNERYKVSRLSSLQEEDGIRFSTNKYKYSDIILKNKNIIDWYEQKHRNKKVKCSSVNVDNEDNKAKLIINTANVNLLAKTKSQSSKKVAGDIYYVKHELKKAGTKCNTLDGFLKHELDSDVSFRNCATKNEQYDIINSLLSPSNVQRKFLPPISLEPVREHDLPADVERYLQELKVNNEFFCKRHITRLSGSMVIDVAWCNFVNNEKEDLKEIITRKLLKPSMYEKDFAAKLQSIKVFNEVQKSCYIDLESKVVRGGKSLVSINVSDVHTGDFNKDEYFKAKSNLANDIDKNKGIHDNNDAVDDYEDNNDNSDDDNDTVDKNHGGNSCSYFDFIRQRYKYDDYNMYWLNEKKRTIELHRKLYAEKLKLQFERHYAICSQTLRDIIDLAIKRAEFKKEYNIEVPYYIWDDWKCLFEHEQHIFDIVNDFGELLSPISLSELDTIKERSRQDILNENNFDSYLNISGNWLSIKIDDIESFENQKRVINHDNQILLGYIVHKALETKYPLQPRPKPAAIPSYTMTAVINGIDNIEALNDLKTLLLNSGILVVDVHAAINFCLQCYHEKMGDNNYESHNESHNEIENDIHSYATVGGMEWEDENPNNKFKTEFTQTTSSLFEINETGIVEEAAKLGHDLFRTMLFGNEIAFGILVDIIIQFIKHHSTNIRGWVLVNFPSTLYQASVLEHALSGKKFPFNLDDDTVSSTGSECKGSIIGNTYTDSNIYDLETEIRSSKIVPNPRKYKGDDTFKSYFKMYVTVIKGFQQDGSILEDNDSCNDPESKSTQLLEQPEKEGIPTLHQFYEEQGISFDLMYETLDLNVIKELVQVILFYFFGESNKFDRVGDMESDELHDPSGNGLLQWNIPTLSTDELSLIKLAFDQRSSMAHVDEQEAVSVVNADNTSSLNKNEEVAHNFADYPIQDSAMIALATFWEAMENIFINGIKEVFFLKRNASYCVIPYIAFINREINLFMNREDDRQTILSEFLDSFNSIHNILRSDFEIKNELHLRVIELKEQLIELCTEKKEEAKELRKMIINQNWTYQDLSLYLNAFLHLSQLEINRCLTTLEYSRDYYMAMLGNYNYQPLPRLVISNINVYKKEASEKSDEDFVTREPELEPNDLFFAVIDRLFNYNDVKDTASPFYDLVDMKLDNIFQEVLKVVSQLEKVISSEETAALKKHKDYMAKKYVIKRVNESSKKKTKKQDQTPIPTAIETLNEEKSAIEEAEEKKDDENKELLLKNLFEEWKDIVKFEIDRLLFRFEIIKKKAKVEFTEIEKVMGDHFSEFDIKINNRFIEEMSCIEDICYLFHTAIEEKTPINARLFFHQNKFYAVKNTVQKQVRPIKLLPALDEIFSEDCFTVKQLERLKEQLVHIAPSGVMTIQAFSQFIQNDVLCDFGHDKMNLLPKIWRDLKPKELQTLLINIFGSYSIIDWKEFLIYCLSMPFPVMEDIIDARLQFLQYDKKGTESVSYNNYMKTTLWFERELPENPLQALHNILAKEFIFSLFTFDNDSVNYIALLLSFCKDVDPKVGFGKALALISGKSVIVYEEDLYLEQIIIDNIQTEYKIVNDILKGILNDVISNAMSGDMDSSSYLKEIAVSQEDSILSIVSNSDTNGILMESMYHEFFRRHLLLQWTSKVPSAIVMSLICDTISTAYVPDSVFLNPDVFCAIQNFWKSNDDYIYIPEFVDSYWMRMIFKQTYKFSALSVIDLIQEVLLQRKE